MRHVEKGSEKNYLVPFIVFQNSTLNSYLKDVLNIHFN